jgi:choline kinase
MKAVILAAGIASRLRPLTLNTPKCLLKIGDKTILERTIENLTANNISDILIVTGFLSEKIKNFINLTFPSIKIRFIENPLYESTNNIYSLWLTRPAFDHSGMLLLDSDIIFDKRIIQKLLNSGYEDCLALTKHELSGEEIKVKKDEQSRIIEIGKEVRITEASGESIGIELFGAKMVSELFKAMEQKIITEKKPDIFYEAAFQKLINEGKSIYAVDTSEFFCMEIDTPDDLSTANSFFTDN